MQLKLTQHGDLPVPAKVKRQLFDVARNAFPKESCGLLLGQMGRITVLRETPNVHPTPTTHFEIEPQALIDAHRAERAGGLKVMGYFHSHPTGEAVPSDTDCAMAPRDGKVWAIVAGERLTFWKDEKDGFHALSYAIEGR